MEQILGRQGGRMRSYIEEMAMYNIHNTIIAEY